MATRMIVYALSEQLGASIRFYEAALGTKGESFGPSWCAFPMGPSRFALLRPDAPQPAHGESFHLDFVVDELDEALARCTAAGARVTRGIQDESFGRSALLRDPEGREFSLIEEDVPAA